MANILDKIAQIRAAVFGKEVRENIAAGIEAINTEVVSTTARQEVVEERQDAVEIRQDSVEIRQDEIDTSEATRITNETNRITSEDIRVTEFDGIKTEYDTYKNIMTSESNVAALQNNININSSALADIAYNLNAVYPRVVPEVNDYGRIGRAIAGIPLGSNLLIPDNLNYDFGGNDIVINRAINILGESKPFFDPLTDTFFQGAIFNTKVYINASRASVKNIGIDAPSKDNGFQIDQGITNNVLIEDCCTNVSAHGYLIQSYLGQVDTITVRDCFAFNSTHGFISKALNVNFINCIAMDMKVGGFGYAFGFISDNIQGANNKGICKDNKAINCHAFNAPYGFMTYSRDMFSEINANGIQMSNLTLTDCSVNNCTRGYNWGEVNPGATGETHNRVYDITCINCLEYGCGSAIEFNRCDNVKFQGMIKHRIFINNIGTEVTNIEYDIMSSFDYRGDIENQVISGNLATVTLLFQFKRENTYTIQNTVTTLFSGFTGNRDKDKIVTLKINEEFTTIVKSGNFALKRDSYSGTGSWVKLQWNGTAWVEIDGFQVDRQQQINITTYNDWLDLRKGYYIDVTGTGTTTNKIKLPYNYQDNQVVKFLIRNTSAGQNLVYGGFDTVNLYQDAAIKTTIVYGICLLYTSPSPRD